MTNQGKTSPLIGAFFRGFRSLAIGLTGLTASSLLAQAPVAVTARVTAVKGTVTASATTSGETTLKLGDTIRGGTVVQSSADGGVLLRPSPNAGLVVYPSSKVRFDGATVAPGGENVNCTILEGKAWFSVGQSSTTPDGTPTTAAPETNVKISVSTPQGVIEGKAGNWTVQYDEGRTMVAVGEGTSLVSIGGGANGAAGGVTGQVEVPKGSVIWLYTRNGVITADLVNTATGTVTQVGADGTLGTPTKADPSLLADSKGALTTPSSSGGTNPLNPGGGTQPTTPQQPQNPDYSKPTPNVPVVSSETP